MISSQ